MEIDAQKIRLLRSYSRTTITSTASSAYGGCASASGLERFLPRTSTPEPESFFYVDDEDCFDPYEIFRTILEIPQKKAVVRGIQKVPHHFITGHLVQPQKNETIDYTSLSLSITGEKKAPLKLSLKARFAIFKKTLKNFFKKHYRSLIRNECDYAICPVTCECQRIKSFLNKRIVLDNDETDAVEG